MNNDENVGAATVGVGEGWGLTPCPPCTKGIAAPCLTMETL